MVLDKRLCEFLSDSVYICGLITDEGLAGTICFLYHAASLAHNIRDGDFLELFFMIWNEAMQCKCSFSISLPSDTEVRHELECNMLIALDSTPLFYHTPLLFYFVSTLLLRSSFLSILSCLLRLSFTTSFIAHKRFPLYYRTIP